MGLGSRKSDQPSRIVVAVAVCPSMFEYRFIFATFVQLPVVAILIVYMLGFCRKVPYNLYLFFEIVLIPCSIYRILSIFYLPISSLQASSSKYSTLPFFELRGGGAIFYLHFSFFSVAGLKPYHSLSTSGSFYYII